MYEKYPIEIQIIDGYPVVTKWSERRSIPLNEVLSKEDLNKMNLTKLRKIIKNEDK